MAYLVCPKCGYERRPTDAAEVGVCPSCGIVFAKWTAHVMGTARLPTQAVEDKAGVLENTGHRLRRLFDYLGEVEPHTNPIAFWARVAVFVVFFFWGWHFILMHYRDDAFMQSFMHAINLPFHEAGHVVFSPFGRFIMILGGTLGQLIMPIIAGAALVVTSRDNFGGSIALWWLGQSFMDCGPYAADARAGVLPLVGGGTGSETTGHDWENMLAELGWLSYDQQVGATLHAVGAAAMLLAFAWGGYILWQQHQNLER